jgi:hypothetical protein
MSWRAMRLAIIYLYAALFMLLGLLVLFWDGAHGALLSVGAGLLFIAEGVGLFIFHWLARLILKISLALAAAAYLALIVKLNSWEAAVVPLGFGGLLLAELWFGKLDRQIAAARRDARKS